MPAFVFLQPPLGLGRKAHTRPCRQGESHAFPEDRGVRREENNSRLEHSNKLPAGNPDKLSGKV